MICLEKYFVVTKFIFYAHNVVQKYFWLYDSQKILGLPKVDVL